MSRQNDIDLYKNKPEIIRQTVAQIDKDFSMFGIPITFSGNTGMAYEEMFHQVAHHVSHLLEYDSHKLTALLYQIDIPQQKIHEQAGLQNEWSIEQVIAELIIHRELKKVLLRNYFKQQGQGL